MVVSGFFSAILVNDAICLVLAPLVLELALDLKRRPTPYLLAVAMASNGGFGLFKEPFNDCFDAISS